MGGVDVEELAMSLDSIKLILLAYKNLIKVFRFFCP
jgi:hypothetical protein